MLKISTQQLSILDEASASIFRRRLVTFLRTEIPEATSSMNDTALAEHIIESEQRAAKYNIKSEAGIAQFVCLTFAVGSNFDEFPEVQDYLQYPDLDTEEKLDELVNYLNALEDDPNVQPSDVLLTPEE